MIADICVRFKTKSLTCMRFTATKSTRIQVINGMVSLKD